MTIQTYRLFEILIEPTNGKVFTDESRESFENTIENMTNKYDFHYMGQGFHIIFELHKGFTSAICKKQVKEACKKLIEISE